MRQLNQFYIKNIKVTICHSEERRITSDTHVM